MKTINNTAIKFGLGLSAVIASVVPAHADPRNDVKDARRDVRDSRQDVKNERKDLRRANTPGERRDAKRELKDAKGDLRDDKRDLRDERQETRPVIRPGFGVRPGVVVRPGYVVRPAYPVRPGYVVRPGVNVRPGTAFGNSFRTFEGTVTNDLKGNDFTIVTTGGQTVRVLVPSGEPGSLSRGDIVRVAGNYSGGTFVARNASVLRNR